MIGETDGTDGTATANGKHEEIAAVEQHGVSNRTGWIAGSDDKLAANEAKISALREAERAHRIAADMHMIKARVAGDTVRRILHDLSNASGAYYWLHGPTDEYGWFYTPELDEIERYEPAYISHTMVPKEDKVFAKSEIFQSFVVMSAVERSLKEADDAMNLMSREVNSSIGRQFSGDSNTLFIVVTDGVSFPLFGVMKVIEHSCRDATAKDNELVAFWSTRATLIRSITRRINAAAAHILRADRLARQIESLVKTGEAVI